MAYKDIILDDSVLDIDSWLPQEALDEIVEAIKKLSETQSTGRFDKKGEEVYELDIVKMHSGELLLVELKDGKYEPICYYTSESFEVVGNVLENPELLKGVEDDTEV